MSMVSFLPWCRIDKAYDVGQLQILPFKRHQPIEGLDGAAQCRVNTILATYKTIQAKPVDRAAIARYAGKSVIDDLNEEERETIRELVAIACFCGLARREYFNELGPYCNSDCFSLYIQKFDRADFTAITTRRREGETLSTWPIDHIAITVPVHCHGIPEVRLDETLLKALISHRGATSNNSWAKWQNAITCFNQANTDSENVRYQVEWVLLCSAFEHILGAKPDAKDVAAKFAAVVVPTEPLLARDATRRSQRWQDTKQFLRYEWMREFYRIRGDFAHGKLNTAQPMVWNPLEHLALASIAFPLVVKCLLKKAGRYEFTDDDNVQIDAFEKFANTVNFLRPPSERRNSLDSHWSRICSDCRSKLCLQRVRNAVGEKEMLPREDKASPAEGDASAGEGA
ncbi:MAG: hypothetical protein KatS3mg102_0366 [Planctomycetota bacterium]|nr:MAG: hypothetical protein KatS3mg102_0366 [Planctomycetota bacterium]